MTYAGRLDPMASGLLLVLAGDEVKNKEKYLALDKEYEFEILFGFATDTHDILGKMTHSNMGADMGIKEIRQNMKFFTGKFKQKYPLYSSKAVKGKQLWVYGRGELAVKRPEREVLVKKLQFLKIRKTNNEKLWASINKRIEKVRGDFRQKDIIQSWRKFLCTNAQENYYIASFKIKCSSGTYVRGIADAMGQRMGIPALAYSIKRTKIGKFAKISE